MLRSGHLVGDVLMTQDCLTELTEVENVACPWFSGLEPEVFGSQLVLCIAKCARSFRFNEAIVQGFFGPVSSSMYF